MGLRSDAIGVLAMMLGAAAAGLSGCGGSDARALFTKPDLFRYERYAVLGLDPEQEQIFMAAYVKTFPERVITFVERGRLRDIMGEQDLLRGRLDERTRARIKRILGVEALIMCQYYADDENRRNKLRVRIVDSETGAIVGSVLVTVAGDFEAHAHKATEALKEDLLGGGYRGYYHPASDVEAGAAHSR